MFILQGPWTLPSGEQSWPREMEDDPNVTDKKFPGNPTKSYRTTQPLKIVAEAMGWKGHSPEVLQGMRNHLKQLDEMGIKAVE